MATSPNAIANATGNILIYSRHDDQLIAPLARTTTPDIEYFADSIDDAIEDVEDSPISASLPDHEQDYWMDADRKAADSSEYSLFSARNAKEADEILQRGADVNQRHSGNYAPIWNAVQKGRADVVDFLLLNGAIVYINYFRYETLLKVAVTGENRDVYEVLTSHNNRQIGAGDKVDGEIALHHVPDAAYADLLLQDGCDVNAFSWSMGTPLHSALRCERSGCYLDANSLRS